jgi:hypothetical protein
MKSHVWEKIDVVDSVEKKTLHSSETNTREEIGEIMKENGKELGVIVAGDEIKLSQNFQSIGTTVRVEMPWYISTTNPGPDLEKGMKVAEEFVDNRLNQRFAEMKVLLATLAAKK